MLKVIFAGPSIAGVDPSCYGDLVVAPPAQCGDVWRAVRDGARLIGLVDGTFETARSPWHKEILFALSHGTMVLGASSMGALRAAEMRMFGMRGVGLVARLVVSGVITDDDEVALLHGPAETGYAPLTEALVNMRATFRRARRMGVLAQATEHDLVRHAKGMFYKDRTYEAVLAAALRDGGLAREMTDWLSTNRRDVKREDALRLLRLARHCAPTGGGPRPAFVATKFWHDFVSEAAGTTPGS
jgi:hypothetical protein